MKQAIKKGAGIRKSSFSDWMNKNGFNDVENENNRNAEKDYEWILMPKAFQEATKLPGIVQGRVVSIMGHSNTGKSTLINHAIVSAQKQGIIPVIIDTENNFSFSYAIDMGMVAEPIYGDVEHEVYDGDTNEYKVETKNEIIHYTGPFMYMNSSLLAERYGNFDYSTGKPTATKRKAAVVEDVAKFMNEILNAQDNGEITESILFIWDSVGSIGCYKAYKNASNNAMWDAASLSQSFGNIINNRIPSTRNISCPYTDTFLYVNKVWMDNTTNPVGPAIMSPKGGKSFHYATRMQIILGGKNAAGIKYLTATSKNQTYRYGIETKVRIEKNQLDSPYNVEYEGKMIACDKGFIAPEDLNEYKTKHITDILKKLNERLKEAGDTTDTIKAEDVKFEEEDTSDE